MARILQHVGQHDRDAISAHQAARLQPACHGIRHSIQLLVPQVSAHAGVRNAGPVSSERLLQQLHQRADLVFIDGGGNIGRVALEPESVDAVLDGLH
jgi:hypothetical protein